MSEQTLLERWQDIIAHLHHTSPPFVLAVTGGGCGALSTLLAVPGASRTLLEGIVPYSSTSLTQWLGKPPEQYCSEATALGMASRACQRARELLEEVPAPEDFSSEEILRRSEAFGLAVTASLVSERPKRGPHRCHLALQSPSLTLSHQLELHKGARTRPQEEQLVSELILWTWAGHLGLKELPTLSLLPGEQVRTQTATAPTVLQEVWSGHGTGLVWSIPRQPGYQTQLTDWPKPVGILCGSFNPLHRGHTELRALAEQRLGGPVYYELSIQNVDKPPLDYLSITRRCVQFCEHPAAITRAARFFEKAQLFPNTVMVVGWDTVARVVSAHYYGGSSEARDAALRHIQRQGCRFLVAGRLSQGQFSTLHDLSIPTEFQDLFQGLEESDFRIDLSSSELRAKDAGLDCGR